MIRLTHIMLVRLLSKHLLQRGHYSAGLLRSEETMPASPESTADFEFWFSSI
jgi:hypothetical protein